MNDIIINSRVYTVSTEYDDCMGAPWKEHDGHGVVSEWTTRNKRAGELTLCSDRSSHRYYDVQVTMKQARKEGWGLGNEARTALAAKLGRDPTDGEITAEAVRRDFEYLRAWCNDEWHWVYVRVEAPDGEFESCGGFDSEDEAGHMECAQDLAERLEDAYQDRQTEEATL